MKGCEVDIRLPNFLKKYFWDVDFEKLKAKTHPEFVLERLLEYGDEKAVNWMKKNYTENEIANVLFHFRGVSPKSANYWALIFNINKKKILCLQKHYLKIRKRHWAY